MTVKRLPDPVEIAPRNSELGVPADDGNPFVGVVVGLVLVSPFWVGIGFLVWWLT